MDLPKNLQIPRTIEDCIYSMRSYIYIDKYMGEVHIREITPCLAPGFVLGVCAQIPFLYSFVKPYIKEVFRGQIHEVAASDQYKGEMARNEYLNSQLLYYEYTPEDCDLALSVLLNAIIESTFGRMNSDFDARVTEIVRNIAEMANIYPMNFFFPQTFRHVMKTTLISVPVLRVRMMSLLCSNKYYRQGSVWSLVKVCVLLNFIFRI